jgi:hypothetical protein
MLYSMVRVKRGLTLVCPEVVADLLSQWRALQRSRGEQVGFMIRRWEEVGSWCICYEKITVLYKHVRDRADACTIVHEKMEATLD